MEDKKREILELLNADQGLFTAEIAQKMRLSPATTAKYLEILKAEGKVKNRKRIPYIYWEKVA